MAVVNKYVNTQQAAEKPGNSAQVAGALVYPIVATFEVAAADDDTSVYRIATLNPNMIPLQILVNNDAITNGTDYDIGLYKPTTSGAVVDADLFADELDLSSAHIFGSELDGMVSLDVANAAKRLYELAGATVKTRPDAYDLALTANTVGTVAGTITIRALLLQG